MAAPITLVPASELAISTLRLLCSVLGRERADKASEGRVAGRASGGRGGDGTCPTMLPSTRLYARGRFGPLAGGGGGSSARLNMAERGFLNGGRGESSITVEWEELRPRLTRTDDIEGAE